MVREMWKLVLNAQPDFRIIADCGSAKEAEQIMQEIDPDVVMLDINLSGDSGFDLLPKIMLYLPNARILAVSMHNIVSYAKRIMNMGAYGYVTKNSTNEELFDAIRSVNIGKKYLCKEVKDLLANQFIEKDNSLPDVNDLSKREVQIISCLREGKSSKEIAELLKISLRTVEVHRYNILHKLKLKNTAALINFISKTEIGI
jgi:two-component system invasion response regulator UvrY